jgi:hypothetical protein
VPVQRVAWVRAWLALLLLASAQRVPVQAWTRLVPARLALLRSALAEWVPVQTWAGLGPAWLAGQSASVCWRHASQG